MSLGNSTLLVANCLAVRSDEDAPDATEAIFDRSRQRAPSCPASGALEVSPTQLQKAMRRGRMTLAERELAWGNLGIYRSKSIHRRYLEAWGGQRVELADLHGLTPYDASYLELAPPREETFGDVGRHSGPVQAKTSGIELKDEL